MSTRKLPLVAAFLSLLPAGAVALDLTPPQTEGPYYPVQKPADTDADLTRIGQGPRAKGEVLLLDGLVVDPEGKPIEKARVEIWQTDAQGIYMHPGDSRTRSRDASFQFYGVTTTDDAGAFSFRTIMPAPYTGRPRHIHAKITPPGGATLTTQFYFKGDADLARDGISRRLGKAALESVTLDPQLAASDARRATVRVVVRRGR